jgi:hypothetical protein
LQFSEDSYLAWNWFSFLGPYTLITDSTLPSNRPAPIPSYIRTISIEFYVGTVLTRWYVRLPNVLK